MFWTLWDVLVLTRNSIRKCETSDTRRDGFLDQTATIPDLCVSALHASFLAKSLAGKIGVYTTLARFQTVRSCRAATCEPNAWKQRLIGGFKPAIGFLSVFRLLSFRGHCAGCHDNKVESGLQCSTILLGRSQTLFSSNFTSRTPKQALLLSASFQR